jgi:hypothetical protein
VPALAVRIPFDCDVCATFLGIGTHLHIRRNSMRATQDWNVTDNCTRTSQIRLRTRLQNVQLRAENAWH